MRILLEVAQVHDAAARRGGAPVAREEALDAGLRRGVDERDLVTGVEGEYGADDDVDASVERDERVDGDGEVAGHYLDTSALEVLDCWLCDGSGANEASDVLISVS